MSIAVNLDGGPEIRPGAAEDEGLCLPDGWRVDRRDTTIVCVAWARVCETVYASIYWIMFGLFVDHMYD